MAHAVCDTRREHRPTSSTPGVILGYQAYVAGHAWQAITPNAVSTPALSFDPMVAATARRPHNRLLAALPPGELARLLPEIELVRLELREVLYDVDQPMVHAHFAETSVISVLGVMADGTAVETATVGHEGMVELPLFLGVDRTPAQAFCQIPGTAYRMSADAFQAEIARGGALRAVVGRYAQALFTQVAQGSACNRLHPVDQRCARWLLQTHDRVGAERGVDEFPLTQRFLSQMLGVRRATVSEVAAALQGSGLIAYEYGRMRVRDRAGLEAAACECYRIIRRELDRLISQVPVGPGPLAAVVTTDPSGRTALRDGDGAAEP